jgi:hypothetical protein
MGRERALSLIPSYAVPGTLAILARVVWVALAAPALAVPVAQAQVVQAASAGTALLDRAAAVALEVLVDRAARSPAGVAGAVARAAPAMAVPVLQEAEADVAA